ncbi:competence CoiA-like predicted nuclease [Scopulibacillus darangshiensis]|uniref:Competence CoiA-like predicted nuclease n=1 Tax=Scopulibacillus darangshiensis TaxID=442528 RepID=A0A4R2P4J5_9BACL|nr:competence protein CoiA family protein [Scopulibacillus darangshiensis]TCP29739.1 competence CoiA-like predicted nuclease [Scopulibacillus darangshiensis]
MLVAKTSDDRIISLAERYSRKGLEMLQNNVKFYCPGCNNPVSLKLGQTRKWHFAHFRNTTCFYENEPESDYHLDGKRELYQWLQSQHSEPRLEYYLPEIRQRPDIYLPNKTSPIAIEYQCASIPPTHLIERTRGYFNKGIQPIWILGGQRLKRKHGSFTLTTMDLLCVRTAEKTSRSSPNLFTSPYTSLFFCPRQKSFVILSNLNTISSSQFLADINVISLSRATLERILHPSIVKAGSHFNKAWLQSKKNKRLAAMPFQNRSEQYIRSLCYKQGLIFSAFPPYAGLPHGHNILISTPSYIWQSWLILTFLFNKKNHMLKVPVVIKAFQGMLDQGLFQMRQMLCTKPSLTSILRGYFDQLCDLGIMVSVDKKTYRVMIDERWPYQQMDQLFLKDKLVLDKLEGMVRGHAKT